MKKTIVVLIAVLGLALFGGSWADGSASADDCMGNPTNEAVALLAVEDAVACGSVSGWHYGYSGGDEAIPWPHLDCWFYDSYSGYYEFHHGC